VRSLQRDSLLMDRVERLMTIPAVGPITALTWAPEVGEVQRFPSIKKAISYCGLCGAEKSSANTVQRTPLSKQRNKHLQTALIEAAKMAPRYSSALVGALPIRELAVFENHPESSVHSKPLSTAEAPEQVMTRDSSATSERIVSEIINVAVESDAPRSASGHLDA